MKIAIAGKGGVGKTTIAATLALIFSEKGLKIIAVDSDPSMNLHSSLGMKNPAPVSELKDLISERTVIEPGVYNMNPKVDDVLEKYGEKKENITLLVMGTIESAGQGCICPENAFLRALLRHVVLKRNELLILDTEAGIEHLGRRTAEKFDAILIVTEPSQKSIETANRIYSLSKQLGIKEIFGIGNKTGSEKEKKLIEDRLDFKVLSFIPYDRDVVDADIAQKPLAEYKNSIARKEIERIAEEVLLLARKPAGK